MMILVTTPYRKLRCRNSSHAHCHIHTSTAKSIDLHSCWHQCKCIYSMLMQAISGVILLITISLSILRLIKITIIMIIVRSYMRSQFLNDITFNIIISTAIITIVICVLIVLWQDRELKISIHTKIKNQSDTTLLEYLI